MSQPVSEHDEFLLSQLLDGDLPADQAAELRARMDREPALRATFEALSHVDKCLQARGADRPAVDWGRFHAAVLSAVMVEPEAGARRPGRQERILRFPTWLRVAMPLAAAAAVAIIVTLWRSPQTTVREGEPASHLQVAYITPTPEPTGTLAVQFNRPRVVSHKTQSPASATTVAFSRSADLENATRQSDEDRQKRPVWQLYSAHHTNTDSMLLSEMADAPL